MKKKYYKQIIKSLDLKLDLEVSNVSNLKKKIAILEASNREKDVKIAGLQTELLTKQYEVEFLKKGNESDTN